MKIKTLNWALVAVLLAVGPLSSCDRTPKPAGPTEEELAALAARERRRTEAEREREREANRRRMMEELRQEDLEKKRAEKAAKAESSRPDQPPVDWERIEDKMTARLLVVGRELGSLRTRQGVLEDVVVMDASLGALTLVHREGEIELAYGELPAQLQEELLFDAEEAQAVAAGKPLPEPDASRLRAVRERVAAERHALAEEAAGGNSDPGGEWPVPEASPDGSSAGSVESEVEGETSLEKRRRLRNVLNEQVTRLSQMQDRGYGAGHAAVQQQKAAIARLEKLIRQTEAEVMKERRSQIGIPDDGDANPHF